MKFLFFAHSPRGWWGEGGKSNLKTNNSELVISLTWQYAEWAVESPRGDLPPEDLK
jgi:hypothetical protein